MFITYCLLYPITWLVSFLFYPISIKGQKNIPRRGGFIFASNHVSNLDPVLLGMTAMTVGRPIHYLAKDSLFKNKIFGFVISNLGAFPIKRASADKDALKNCLKLLKGGAALVVFPEGTRKAKEKSKNALPGVGFIAVKSGVPVIPVRIVGSDAVLPPGKKFPTRRKIQIYIGSAITLCSPDDYQAVANQIQETIYLQPQGRSG